MSWGGQKHTLPPLGLISSWLKVNQTVCNFKIESTCLGLAMGVKLAPLPPLATRKRRVRRLTLPSIQSILFPSLPRPCVILKRGYAVTGFGSMDAFSHN